LLIRKKRLTDILAPGEYWIFTLGRNIELERYNIKDPVFASERADYIVREQPELAARFFTVVDTSDSQVAVVYLDGKLARLVRPGNRVLFWRGAVALTFDLIDVRKEPEVPERLLPALARFGKESSVTFAVVEQGKRGLVYIDGRLVRELEAGTYGFWNVVNTPRVDVLEVRRQTVEVSGQEILTKDKVTVRVNISAVYEIVNIVTARSGVKDVNEHLYRTLQIAIRQTLGKRTLEEVLADKADIDETVSAEVRREMELYGVRVGVIALKDIILPGDIRDILNQVVTAEKQAQANLIRRR
jgi:hypothetical protein